VKAPRFWWRKPGLAARLLQPASLLYGAIAERRMDRPGSPGSVPVICIGNVTVGGSGKTPTAIHVAFMLRSMGRNPAFLTRGYGGALTGPVKVDPARHSFREVGDEALLLARHGPTIVARDRPAGAALAASLGADVVIMDDGLQNPSLAKDLAIAVFDGAVGIGNGLPLPAGPLRARLSVQWERIDAVLVIGPGEPGGSIAAEARRRERPILLGELRPDPDSAARLRGRRVLAFAGIGRPEKFFTTLEACGADVVSARAFPDHHPFGAGEIRSLSAQAKAEGLHIVTTEKDLARLAGFKDTLAGAAEIAALPVALTVDREVVLADLLRDAVSRR